MNLPEMYFVVVVSVVSEGLNESFLICEPPDETIGRSVEVWRSEIGMFHSVKIGKVER